MIDEPIRFAADRTTPSKSPRSVGAMPTLSVPDSRREASWPSRRGIRANGSACVPTRGAGSARAAARPRSASPRARPPPSARSGPAPGRAPARSSRPARASCRRARTRSAAGSVTQRDPLEIGERLAGADPAQRAPVVARQLPAKLVHERRLVRAHRRQREREDQVGHVVRAVLRDREQEERELTRVSSSRRPSSPKSSSTSRPSSVRRTFPRCGSAW